MKPKSSPTGSKQIEAKPKRTSIGDGKRKLGSFSKKRTKPRRGQGR
jgi:hypothetical protein